MFKHNQKVRFKWAGVEHTGTYSTGNGTTIVHWIDRDGNSCFSRPDDLTNLRPVLKSFDDPQVGDVYKHNVWGEICEVIDTSDRGVVIFLKDEEVNLHVKLKEKLSETFTILQDEEESAFEIVPSPRLDYCCDCKREHGYDCPTDKQEKSERVRVLEEVEVEIAKIELDSRRDKHFPDYNYSLNKLLSRIQELKDSK